MRTVSRRCFREDKQRTISGVHVSIQKQKKQKKQKTVQNGKQVRRSNILEEPWTKKLNCDKSIKLFKNNIIDNDKKNMYCMHVLLHVFFLHFNKS